jgi:hypothetical protein
MATYTERPKKGTPARLAWDLFVHERNEKPESVEYSPNYDGQYKGWVCNHYIADPLIKHQGYAGWTHYTFYHSSELTGKKDTINAYDYKEPLEREPLVVDPEPTAEEIAEHSRLLSEFMALVKKGYRQGKGVQGSRDALFKEHGVTSMKEYLAKHNCCIYAHSTPSDPITYKYHDKGS